jgi:hypothetical protein
MGPFGPLPSSMWTREQGVLGLDASALMIWLTRTRNRRAVTRGQVTTLVVTSPDLPLACASVDHVMSLHCIHVWPDQQQHRQPGQRIP